MQNSPPWHLESAQATLNQLGSQPSGLSGQEAGERLKRYGPNRLTPPKQRTALQRFLQQFNNVLIYVLLGSSLVTAALGEWVDTGVILGVVLINGIIGFLQEGKAEKSLDAIRNMLSLHATVLRDGHRQEIAAEDLVPGDIVLLASGDKVPADLRLIESRNLRIEEAALTGESIPVEKHPDALAEEVPIGDRRCMAYSSTMVVFGQGRGVVVNIADQTEVGRIGRMLADVESVTTPLLRQMAVFGQWLTVGILILSLAILGYGMLVHDYSMADMFLAAVGIAVAAIPEGLPAIMTITLAIGVQRMAARKAIIRRMPAVETLGAVTVVCSDKTGTLTRNEMTVRQLITRQHHFQVEGSGYAPRGGFAENGQEVDLTQHPELLEIGRIALLCNDATLRETGNDWVLEGDPTEGALLTLGRKIGLDPHFEAEALPRIDVIPFESEHRFMATLHHDHTGHAFAYIKGAPEAVLSRCAWQQEQGECTPIKQAWWEEQIHQMAREGQRVLALALVPMPEGSNRLDFEHVTSGLTLVTLAGIIDPPRDEAIRAVAQCQAAGICVKMITGDHGTTAQAIGADLGIGLNGRVLTGNEVEAMSDTDLSEAVENTDVFARASPEHKLRLVQALQTRGEVVAMTGDGVNDAPALKRADVGVAMGHKGTEAAKEAGEMVLANDNFATIAAAVEEGRNIYDNLRKAVVYVLPTSTAQAAMVVVAVLLGMTLPITPVQILWVNMVTAVTLSLAFAFEKAEPGIMNRPPRDPREALVNGFMLWRIGFVTLLMVIISFGLFLWELDQGTSEAAARTVAVNALVVAEMFYLFNCRRLHGSILNREGFLGNSLALQAVGGLFLLQLAFTYLPFMQALFQTEAISLEAWLRILGAGLVLMLVVEGEKQMLKRWRQV